MTDSGAWHYAFAYDIAARYYPELPEQAHYIGESEARQKLVQTYLHSVGAARESDIRKLFGWRPVELKRALEALAQAGELRKSVKVSRQPGDWVVSSQLLADIA